MPDLHDDLIEDLRRYGEATEAAADRHRAPLADYPVGGERARASRRRASLGRGAGSTAAVTAAPTPVELSGPQPHRRRMVLVAVAAVLALVVATVGLVQRSEGSSPAVDTPPTVEPAPTGVEQTKGTLPASDDVPAAPPFQDGTVLMWLPYVGQPQYLAQRADRPVSLDVGPAELAGCCNGIATINTMAGFIADGTLHTADRVGLVVDTGVAGERVVADGSYGAFYVVDGSELTRYAVSLPAGIDGRWTIPDGWELPSHSSASEVLDGRVILERSDRSRADHEIGVWVPETGDIRSIGRAQWVIDATMYVDGAPKVAWVAADCPDQSPGGCGLVITDLDTMENRTATAPGVPFIGGGAFSHDGHLALFVGGQGQVAQLAVLDVATMETRVLPGTTVTIGEWFGSATWTLDNRAVIYHGGGESTETRVIDIDTGEQRTLPWDITYSMATIP